MNNHEYVSPLVGSLWKIQRANHHIDNFNVAIKSFLDTRPYRLVVEPDSENPGKRKCLVARVSGKMPCDLLLILGDAVHNLRASLDILACDLVRLNNPGCEEMKWFNDIYFPFGKDRERYKSLLAEKEIRRVSDDAMAVLRTLAPYIGGNKHLRAIHDLDIRDKHKLILTTQSIGNIVHQAFGDGANGRHTYSDFTFSPIKDGTVILRLPFFTENIKINDEVEFEVGIEFYKGMPLEGECVRSSLNIMQDVVIDLVNQFRLLYGHEPIRKTEHF